MRPTSIPIPAHAPSAPGSDTDRAVADADTATNSTRPGGDVARRGRARVGPVAEADPLEVVDDIVVLDGSEGERLAQQQARVLWEVTQWVARNRSAPGRPTAA